MIRPPSLPAGRQRPVQACRTLQYEYKQHTARPPPRQASLHGQLHWTRERCAAICTNAHAAMPRTRNIPASAPHSRRSVTRRAFLDRYSTASIFMWTSPPCTMPTWQQPRQQSLQWRSARASTRLVSANGRVLPAPQSPITRRWVSVRSASSVSSTALTSACSSRPCGTMG